MTMFSRIFSPYKAIADKTLRRAAAGMTRKDLNAMASRKARLLALAGQLPLRQVGKDVCDMVRMLCDVAAGRYKAMPWRSVGAVLVALGYLLCTLDGIPDIVPMLGFTDDITVITWCLSLVNNDLQAWRNQRAQGAPA